MKKSECFFSLFFAMLLVPMTVCVGNEDGAVRYGVVHDGVVHIDFSDPIFSRLDEDGKNVLSEYAKVYPKIKKFYGNLRMDVIERIFRHTASNIPFTYEPLNSPPILTRETLYEVRYNTRDGDTRRGGFSRVDSHINLWMFQGKNIQENSGWQLNLITPETGYALVKNNPKNRFYSLTAKRKLDHTFGVEVLGFDTAPFSVDSLFMEELFFRKSLSWYEGTPYFVVSAKYIDDDKEGQMVELVSQIDRPAAPSTWTVRLSRKHWVIKDVFEQGWSKGGVRYWERYRCVYDGEFEGMPLLSSYQTNFGIYDTDSEMLLTQVRYDVTKIVPGPVDLSEFDVAQFLPPNVKIGEFMEPARLSAARIAAIVIGIILIIWGVYMKIRNRN